MPTITHTLSTPDVDLGYQVITPDSDASTRPKPTLLIVGHPMGADGFTALAGHFGDRTVVTYDPRGIGRSTRKDGRSDRGPDLHVADLHALITELGGPVDVFASSGGAVNCLALVASHPDDVHTLVAHEPPLLALLPDADAAFAAERDVQQRYHDHGWGAGMAGFIALVSWQGEFGPDYSARPPADPAALGLPTQDDGGRDDPLLSGTANGVTGYVPSAEAIAAASSRVVLGLGAETGNALTARTTRAAADVLGLPIVEFPGGHGGFAGEDEPYPGQATPFAETLRQVLDA